MTAIKMRQRDGLGSSANRCPVHATLCPIALLFRCAMPHFPKWLRRRSPCRSGRVRRDPPGGARRLFSAGGAVPRQPSRRDVPVEGGAEPLCAAMISPPSSMRRRQRAVCSSRSKRARMRRRGKPGRTPRCQGGARSLLRELSRRTSSAAPLGCALDPDAVDLDPPSSPTRADTRRPRPSSGPGDLPRRHRGRSARCPLREGRTHLARCWIAGRSPGALRLASRGGPSAASSTFTRAAAGNRWGLPACTRCWARALDILGVASVRADDRDSVPSAEDLMAHMLFKRVPESHG